MLKNDRMIDKGKTMGPQSLCGRAIQIKCKVDKIIAIVFHNMVHKLLILRSTPLLSNPGYAPKVNSHNSTSLQASNYR